MAQHTTKTYSKQEQKTITTEADTAVQKALAPISKKYPGVVIAHQLGFTFPAEPVIVSHTGTTRPLTAKDVSVPPPEAQS